MDELNNAWLGLCAGESGSPAVVSHVSGVLRYHRVYDFFGALSWGVKRLHFLAACNFLSRSRVKGVIFFTILPDPRKLKLTFAEHLKLCAPQVFQTVLFTNFTSEFVFTFFPLPFSGRLIV